MTAKQWNTVNIIFLKCVLFMAIVKTVYAVRCFECKGTPFPRDCAKVVTCGPDEFCSVEQVVTTSGLIVYNSGCLSQSQCVMYGPLEYINHPDAVYRGACENNVACNVLSTALKNSHCPPYCCSDDFCNTKCGSQTNGSLTTPAQQSTVPLNTLTSTAAVQTTAIQPPATTKHLTNVVTTTTASAGVTATKPASATHPPYCPNDYLYDEWSAICVKVVDGKTYTYHDAEAYCNQEGDELVTIDSHEKMVFIETILMHHSQVPLESRLYWIGAHAPSSGHKTFQWPNGQHIQYTYWGGHDEVYPNEQPDKDANQRCVMIVGKDHYMWHDDTCSDRHRVVCEKKDITSPNLQVTATTVISTTNTHHGCDTHGGFELVNDNPTPLCIKVRGDAKTWDQARAACQQEGGDLLVLDTNSMAKIMKDKVYNHLHHSYWIGGRDFDMTNTFKWVDMTNIDLHNGFWAHGQPNNFDANAVQDCVVMWNNDKGWHDDRCDKALPFICERPI